MRAIGHYLFVFFPPILQDPQMLDQLAKNITRCGLSNSTLNYLRVSKFPSWSCSFFFFFFFLVTYWWIICVWNNLTSIIQLWPLSSSLKLCVILEPMQELMSRHKTYSLSPRDCLKTCLFQKWQRMVAPPGNAFEIASGIYDSYPFNLSFEAPILKSSSCCVIVSYL